MGEMFDTLRMRFDGASVVVRAGKSTEETAAFDVADEQGDSFKMVAKGGMFDGASCRFVADDRWEVADHGTMWPGTSVIKRLSHSRSGESLFLARTTPYVCVASELLGADIEVLGTYLSAATNRTTYHSYFVVSKKQFPAAPDLPALYNRLRQKRARFVYHSPFSTSSFFLPSLYFRAQKLFHMRVNRSS